MLSELIVGFRKWVKAEQGSCSQTEVSGFEDFMELLKLLCL